MKKAVQQALNSPLFSPRSSVLYRLKAFPCTEDKRDAPDSRKSYHCINNTADECVLTAAYPCNYIKLKKTYASPVKCADYSEYQRYSIHYHVLSSLSATKVDFSLIVSFSRSSIFM